MGVDDESIIIDLRERLEISTATVAYLEAGIERITAQRDEANLRNAELQGSLIIYRGTIQELRGEENTYFVHGSDLKKEISKR